jgi:N-acyl-D-amino-acid deacylase
MHDLVIRGGTIIDGSGKEGYIADIAIDGEGNADRGTGADARGCGLRATART